MATAGALALIGVVGSGSTAARTGLLASAVSARACPLTVPNGKEPPASARDALPPVPPVFHGNGKLWVKLWPFGVIVARPNVVRSDGSIDIKLPWWRGVPGMLTITGTRLDAPAPRVRSHVPNGYGRSGFQPSGVTFPTQGCWKVTGHVGRTRLKFVTLVVTAADNGY